VIVRDKVEKKKLKKLKKEFQKRTVLHLEPCERDGVLGRDAHLHGGR